MASLYNCCRTEGKSKAEVNFLRIYIYGWKAPSGSVQNKDKIADSDADPEWRKLEAYARRMRELLAEVRRGDTPPPAERIAEYESMLAAAAVAADDARRKQDTLPLTADVLQRIEVVLLSQLPIQSAGFIPLSPYLACLSCTQVTSLERASTRALDPPRKLLGAPGLHAPVASTLPQSLADRRSQLLGGVQPRLRVGKRGGAGGGHGSHLHEQLAADRKVHERMKEELVNMTGALKR